MIYIHILYFTGRKSIREELFSVMEKKLWDLMGKPECYQIQTDSLKGPWAKPRVELFTGKS